MKENEIIVPQTVYTSLRHSTIHNRHNTITLEMLSMGGFLYKNIENIVGLFTQFCKLQHLRALQIFHSSINYIQSPLNFYKK